MPRSPCGVGIPGLYPNTVRFFERTALLCEISRGCPANGRPRFLCQILQHYGLLFGGAFIIATAGKSKELEINGQIRDREVRLIGADGEQKGVVSIQVAMRAAEEAGLDLVKIAPTAKPPVCRIMDYGKYKFDQAKKEKEARKKQKTVDVKELRLSPSIDTHDVQVKVKKANEFLKDGDKVKISIRFRGREIGHSKVGMQIMEDFAKATEEFGTVDKQPKMEGKSLVMFLAPKN